jgi:predicted alpha/beta superfamily hydrolase
LKRQFSSTSSLSTNHILIMKKTIIIPMLISMFIINNIYSQPSSIQFKTTSKYVQEATYVIDIILPDDYDSSYQYPVAYCVDYWLGSKFVPGMLYCLNFSQSIDPIIVVGIGNEGSISDWQMERTRDLTPTHIPEYDVSDSHSEGTSGVSGGADNFLLFIKNELIPLVESRYSVDTLNRGFFGYSLGGLFGVYAIIDEPHLFQRYYLGSPSVQYNDFALLDSLNNMLPEELAGIKSIYISVGEREDSNMLKGFADLRDCFKEKNIPLLDMHSQLILDEGHRSAVMPAYYKAFKYLYEKK